MVLDHGTQHWRITGDSPVGDDMLADMVAIGGASPKQQTEVDGCIGGVSRNMDTRICRKLTKRRVARLAIFFHTSLIDLSISCRPASHESRTETQWRKSGSRSPSEALAIWTRSKHATRQNAGLLSSRSIIVGSTCATQVQGENHGIALRTD